MLGASRWPRLRLAPHPNPAVRTPAAAGVLPLARHVVIAGAAHFPMAGRPYVLRARLLPVARHPVVARAIPLPMSADPIRVLIRRRRWAFGDLERSWCSFGCNAL